MSKRASYREAIEWIALNDGAGDPGWLDEESVSNQVTVCLIADLFDKKQEEIGKAVVTYRKKHSEEF